MLDYAAAVAKGPKDERTAEIKNYEYAVAQGYDGTFEEFKDNARTTHLKDYQAAVASGYEGGFHQWMMELRKAGATNINLGQQTEKEQMQKQVASEEYFTSPKFGDDISKHLGSVRTKIMSSDNPDKQAAVETIKFIEAQLSSSGGQILGVRREGSSVIWTVKFPSGRTKEVRRVIQ